MDGPPRDPADAGRLAPPPVPRVKVTAPPLRALHRERLIATLRRALEGRVALVVAPAGSGKTTLLAQFAAVAGVPVAWYRAEPDDAAAEAMLRGLAAALATASCGCAEAPSVDHLVASVDRSSAERALLVVDDLHAVAGTEGEIVVERLVEHAPPALRIVLASRCTPAFNLSRLRVGGDLVEVGPDDLRFRSWEAEQLFDEFYGAHLPPGDLAELARRTEGWAAGLQLFHLATRGKSLPERRRILAELSTQSGMVREYLTQNVLDDLPDEVRRFLLRTCVLERLTGPLCDQLLGTTGSEKVLDQLVRRQIFTVRTEGGAAFRYHEVLRAHLAGTLVAEIGEAEAKQRHHEAGEVLERSGAVSEALWAYCRAGDWHAAAHLLGRNGGPVGPTPGQWIDALPPGLLDLDPWLTLAKARRYLEIGHWRAAFAAYRAAERRFGAGPGQDTCGRERQAVALWLDPAPNRRSDWLGLLRAATQGDPLQVSVQARRLPGATGRFTQAAALVLAGRMGDGRRLLEAVAALPDAGPVVGPLARLLAAGVGAVATGTSGEDWDALVEDLEAAGLAWPGLLVHATLGLIRGADASAGRRLRSDREAQGDEWGAALLTLAEASVRLSQGRPAATLFDEAAARFRRLDAATLERWAGAGLALASAREGFPRSDRAPLSPATAVGHGVPGAAVLSLLALAVGDGGQGDHYAGLARAAAAECGVDWPAALFGPPEDRGEPDHAEAGGAGSGAAGEIRCFGGFELRLGGSVIDVTAVKPRVRAALHLLAVHAGRPIHRERLITAFWPDVDARAGVHNLQVVVSSLRRLLDGAPGPTGPVQIARESDAYRLVLPPGVTADVAAFEAAVLAVRRARKDGDDDAAIAAADDALRLYTGDLVPEAGPADWVVEDRDRYRQDAADVCQHLAELRSERNEQERAAEACLRGLSLDRYRDALWRTLIVAYDSLDDSAIAARTRQAYLEVLDELGVGAD